MRGAGGDEKENPRRGNVKHFSSEDAVDFVNGVATTEKRAEMQAHLNSGCNRCAEAVETFQHVQHAAASENAFQPPADAVRIAKAAFGAIGTKAAPSGLRLIFDSLLQPATVGVRSAGDSCTRQLLYGVAEYLLDLYIAPRSGGKVIGVTGQLLNSKHPELILKAVPIVVSNKQGSFVVAVTNHFGEFQAEVANTGDLELRLPTPEGQDIVIPLSCLMVNLTRGVFEKATAAQQR
jgi:hypothetical protein